MSRLLRLLGIISLSTGGLLFLFGLIRDEVLGRDTYENIYGYLLDYSEPLYHLFLIEWPMPVISLIGAGAFLCFMSHYVQHDYDRA